MNMFASRSRWWQNADYLVKLSWHFFPSIFIESKCKYLIGSSPKSDIVQSCGRILRKSHGTVEPIIVDMVDKFSVFGNQSNKRLKFYRSKKYDVMDYEVQDITGEILSEKKNEAQTKKKKTIKVDTDVCLF